MLFKMELSYIFCVQVKLDGEKKDEEKKDEPETPAKGKTSNIAQIN